MDSSDLHSQLLDDARRYDPAQHTRSLLAPFRDVLLLQRAKFMSYEQISATLARHGLKVSPAAVGCFCRRHFSKAEIEAIRRQSSSATAGTPASASRPGSRPALLGAPPREPGKRGPKIARDDF